jgi:hypothetical protein
MQTDDDPIEVPEHWIRAATDLVVQIYRSYGGPLALVDFGIAVAIHLAGDQNDEFACAFGATIPITRKHGKIIGLGSGLAGAYVSALTKAVEGKVELWKPSEK